MQTSHMSRIAASELAHSVSVAKANKTKPRGETLKYQAVGPLELTAFTRKKSTCLINAVHSIGRCNTTDVNLLSRRWC